jgi:hypothetical protein
LTESTAGRSASLSLSREEAGFLGKDYSREILRDLLIDREMLDYLRATISEMKAARAQSIYALAEANRLRGIIEKIESPLIDPKREQKGT